MEHSQVGLRPVEERDLVMLTRHLLEPEVSGRNWAGFRDAGAVRKRFEKDSYLGKHDSLLIITAGGEAAGFISWTKAGYGYGPYWLIGIILLPEWRGQGIGSAAQSQVCEYLFAHTSAQRIAAETQPDNIAEQRALENAGFTREAVLRSAEYRDGAYQDVVVYARLRGEPSRR